MRRRLLSVAIVLVAAASTLGQGQPPPLVPADATVSQTVRATLDDPVLTDDERDRLRIFHGLFEEVSDAAKSSADLALARYDLLHEAVNDSPEAALLRGEPQQVEPLLGDSDGPQAALLRARAMLDMGRFDAAVAVLHPIRQAALRNEYTTAEDLTAAAQAIAELATLEGRGAQDYHTVLDMLGRAQQQVDRLYWPALVAQGRLLVDKDNPQEAVTTLHEALRLNPSSSDVYYLLGRIALTSFDFASVERAIEKLRAIQPQHVLADVLAVEMYLTQKDAISARAALAPALDRYPAHRHLLAADAAVAALAYDAQATVAPGHPLAVFMVGKYLSMARQYEAGAAILRQAIVRQPNWTEPRIELGLMLNQAGEDEQALQVLRAVVELDPFNKRALNTLKLQEELAGYKTLETDHFIIRYRDDIDAVLAADMPPVLEDIYRDVTTVFGHQPQRKTLIEIMPDKRWFAVRITGMPWIWTIGACTGPVIAITPPREGRHHAGSFDWAAVIRHEFVHTVTLSQTGNRIAHWFTEALAVSQEPGPRDFDTAQLLASALAHEALFDLKEINWAFVRPKRPQDRALAYAQAHWMQEYIIYRYGQGAVLKMLDLSRQAIAEEEVVPRATGTPANQFFDEFKQWAARQVQSWGLSPQPPAEQIVKRITESQDPSAEVDALLAEHPSHPDVLRLAAERSLELGGDEESMAWLLKYAAARPIDPWADRRIIEVSLRMGDFERAISHLEELDRFDQKDGSHAIRLVELYRRLQRLDDAQSAARRALHRQPYNATLREQAATIALQRGDIAQAEHHLKTLPRIEPQRALHHVRLAAFYHRQSKHSEADAHARAARKLDPAAAVEQFLRPE
jgi:cellulose synthase operon protein C